MSYAQPAFIESESSWFRGLLMRGFSLDSWRRMRREGRTRTIRRLAVAACLYPVIMITMQAWVLVIASLPLSLMLTRAYLAWAVPVMIAFPIAVWTITRLAWDLREEHYRSERLKLGQRPTPLMNESVDA